MDTPTPPPVANPVPMTYPVASVTPPPSHRHLVPILSVGLVLIALVVIANAMGVWPSKADVAVESATPTPGASVTPNPTADWKTVDLTGARFMIPNNWGLVNDESGGGEPIIGSTVRVGDHAGIAKLGQDLSHPSGFNLDIFTDANFHRASGESFTQALVKLWRLGSASKVSIKIGSYDAVRYGSYMILDLGDKAVAIHSFGIADNEIDQIFSTFTFTTPPTAEWTNFSSQYFTLSFMVPPGFEVIDATNSIRIAQIPYTTRAIGDDTAFFALTRYAPGDTMPARKAAYLGINPDAYTQSTIMVDGTSFPMVTGTDPGRFEGTSAGKIIAVFFEKSFVEVIERPANSDVNYDPLSLAKQILSTFRFTTSPTAEWKTYTSQLMNISFQYPSDWTLVEGNDFPGSAQGDNCIKLTKESELIAAYTKRDCIENATYCKRIDPWPAFSTTSTNAQVKSIIDSIVTSARHL